MNRNKVIAIALRRGLLGTVAETVVITHRRGLCPKQSAPLSLGSGALTLNCTPLKSGVLLFSSAPTLELPG